MFLTSLEWSPWLGPLMCLGSVALDWPKMAFMEMTEVTQFYSTLLFSLLGDKWSSPGMFFSRKWQRIRPSKPGGKWAFQAPTCIMLANITGIKHVTGPSPEPERAVTTELHGYGHAYEERWIIGLINKTNPLQLFKLASVLFTPLRYVPTFILVALELLEEKSRGQELFIWLN